ncbi:MAG: type II toxin-antitoxin system VapC family toxin [Vicinamibacteria bacterium]|nr:type II toxin-antitoxin system VapC family toxin [Vicinamibacteria bacterium]
MKALDTNVVVRVLTGDDRAQARAATDAMRGQRLWVSRTVLLECEWVLRISYELDRRAIHAGLSRLLAYPLLEVDELDAVQRALDWYELGLDFADALHLASAPRAETLLTFDASLARKANRIGTRPRVERLV